MSVMDFTFRGLMAPVFTPFHQNKGLNPEVIPEYAKYLHDNGIRGVLVNGTSGEGVSMTTTERESVLEKWVEACHTHELTIMAQIGGTNMADVKSLAKHAESFKVSGILCLADLFFKPSTVDELIRYLKIISNEAPKTPLFYYHIPGFTGINLNMKELLEKSSEIPTFKGIKFTDNDLEMGTSCISINKQTVFLGNDTLLLSGLIQGFESVIGTTVNIFPFRNKKIIEHFHRGEFSKAIAEQKKLNEDIKQITKFGSWVSSMKAAMRLLTPINVGPVREPLVNVDEKKIKTMF